MGHGTGAEHLEQLSAAQVQPLKVANAPPILTIVVPTLNERDNIKPLIALLDAALANVAWEGIFVGRRVGLESGVRRMSGDGFKILLDLLASSSRPLRVCELPFQFRTRRHGESKLDTLVVWEYFALLADKLFGHIVPVRFALFALIGAVGLAVHMSILWSGLHFAAVRFGVAQSLATLAANA